MTVLPALPAEQENRLKACVKQLEPLPNTGEQLFSAFLLSQVSFHRTS